MAKIIITAHGEQEQEIPLQKSRMLIGRHVHNDIVIDRPGISAHHAAIVVTSNEVFVEDLDSTNGTKVNGQPVSKHFLQSNDLIEIADLKMRYVAGPEEIGKKLNLDLTQLPAISQLTSNAHITVHEDQGFFGDDAIQIGADAILKVLDGAHKGKTIGLTKSLHTIGRPGIQIAAITYAQQEYRITHVVGASYPLVNGDSIGESIHLLKYDDVIDIDGTHMLFCHEDHLD